MSLRLAQAESQKLTYTPSNMTWSSAMAQAAVLSDSDLKRVLRYCQSRRHAVRDATVVLFSLHTGLRAKELAALEWCDVFDSDARVRERFTLRAAQTKGQRARAVFINTQLRAQLERYRSLQRRFEAHAPLFASQHGRAFSANTMCQLFLNIYKGCGLEQCSSHSGRRTFITRLANNGVGVRALAELAGHSSISVTQRYIDVNDEQLARAVELI